MTEKIGVYLCECGPNIKDAIDLTAVATHAQGLRNVGRTLTVGLVCSAEGMAAVAHDIRDQGLQRVVFAGCSPKEHELTFKKIMEQAGLNPYLMQVANLREQCAWVTPNKESATRKARKVIAAAVERVRQHHPLQSQEIDVRPDVLVIGAGIAGLSAAQCLAQQGRRVFLIEKLPSIGGRTALYEGLFPDLGCAACMMNPLLDGVLHNDSIELTTLAEVSDIRGYYGNFDVRIRQRARYVNASACIGCKACIEACPVRVKNRFNQNLDSRTAVYIPHPGSLPHLAVIDRQSCLRFQGHPCTACRDACPFGAVDYDAKDTIIEIQVGAIVIATGFDTFDPRTAHRSSGRPVADLLTGPAFERLANSSGPTGGRIALSDGKTPETVAIALCVGSRSERFNDYCSGVCCRAALKHAHQVLEQLPGATIYIIYADMCLPGCEAQRFFNQLSRQEAIRFVRTVKPGALKVSRKAGRFVLAWDDAAGRLNRISADLVVLETAMEPSRGTRQLAKLFEIPLDRNGFFKAGDTVISPVSTARKGVYIAGCAQGPKDIPASIAQGQAAAGRILQELIPGEKLPLEPMIADLDETRCSGCMLCKSLCAFQAISASETGGPASINRALCMGCGICAAACPGGAITARHYSGDAIRSEINGLLNP